MPHASVLKSPNPDILLRRTLIKGITHDGVIDTPPPACKEWSVKFKEIKQNKLPT